MEAFDVWVGSAQDARHVAAATRIAGRAFLTAELDQEPIAIDQESIGIAAAGSLARWPATVRHAADGVVVLEVDSDARLPSWDGPIRWAALAEGGTWTVVTVAELTISLHPFAADGPALIGRLAPDAPPPPPGSGVFHDDLLVGMVSRTVEDTAYVVPATALVEDSTLRGAIESVTGRRLVCESLPLLPTLRPWTTARQPDLPTSLLSPVNELVPFVDRPELTDRLRSWCLSSPGLAVLTLAGAAGGGKTRLARHLAADLQPGWTVGVLSEAPPEDWIETIGGTGRPLLLIVEHPQRQVGRVGRLIERLAAQPGGYPVRVLLLAREVGGWHNALRRAAGPAADLVDPAPIEVPPLAADAWQDHVEVAYAAFARRLGVSGSTPGPDQPDRSVPLTAHQAALALLLRDAAHRDDDDRAVLVAHELAAWDYAADNLDVPSGDVRRAALSAVLLSPPNSLDEARRRLRRLGGAAAARLDEFATWIAVLHPPADPAAWHWSTPAPEQPLADVIEALIRPTELEPFLIGLDPEPAATAMGVLFAVATGATAGAATGSLSSTTTGSPADTTGGPPADAMGGPPAGGTSGLLAVLSELVRTYPPVLGPAAVATVAVTPAALGALDGLHADVRAAVTPADRCQRIAGELPDELSVIAAFAADLADVLIARYHDQPGADRALAPILMTASRAALARGDLPRALDHATEAVGRYQTAIGQPAGSVLRPSLIAARRVRAELLRRSGQLVEAGRELTVAAVDCGQLTTAVPELEHAGVALELLRLSTAFADATPPDLDQAVETARTALDVARSPSIEGYPPLRAEAWRLLGWAHLLRGADADALDALGRAADGYRSLTLDSPGRYLAPLARTLDARATALGRSGDRWGAVVTGEEALHVQRQVTDGELPALVDVLLAQAGRLGADGRRDRALDLALEAMRRAERLYDADPVAHLPLLAAAAAGTGVRLCEHEEWTGALEHTATAVRGYERLAGDDPAYRVSLAVARHNHAALLVHNGQFEAGRDEARRAVELWRQLSTQDPDLRPELAAALHNAALAAQGVGDAAQAAADALEAVDVYAALEPGTHRRYTDDHTFALETMMNLATATDRPDEAIAAARRLVATERVADQDDPERDRLRLAQALDQLIALHRGRPDQDWTEVLRAAEEAVTLYDALSATGPVGVDERRVSARYTVAAALAALDRPSDAVPAAREAVSLARQGRSVPIDLQAGLLTLMSKQQSLLGDGPGAISTARRLVRLRYPRRVTHPAPYASALLVLSERLAEHGDLEEAVAACEDAVAIGHRQIVLGHPELRAQQVETLRTAATQFLALGLRGQAINALDDAVGLLIDLGGSDRSTLASTAATLAQLEYDDRRYAEAIEHLRRAITEYRILADAGVAWAPTLADCLLRLGHWLEGESEHDAEFAATSEAVALLRRLHDAGTPGSRTLLVDALRRLGRRQRGRHRDERARAAAEADALDGTP